MSSSSFRLTGSSSTSLKGKESTGRDPLATHGTLPSRAMGHHTRASSSMTSVDRHTDSSSKRQSRSSLFVAASDAIGLTNRLSALGFGGGRKPKASRPSAGVGIVLPDVIEISAQAGIDQEADERERLRTEAAQALGLEIVHPSIQEEAEEPEVPFQTRREDRYHDILTDIQEPAHPLTGSMPTPTNTHSPTTSLTPTHIPIPRFPAAHSALVPSAQFSAVLLKYYPPPSLRIFALSKQWKTRFMLLSSPSLKTGAASYLHLFKSSSPDEKELERLEINVDSVVFISEEDVGGRRHVIKVGGVDVGALRKDLITEENGKTMWFFHVSDQVEAQRWITTIKGVIFGQKTMRAGLGHATPTLTGIEPRGDMDVMLSMRAQGILSSPTKANFNDPSVTPTNSSPRLSTISPEPANTSSSSVRTQKSIQAGTVSALNRLFSTSSNRPRSSSRATNHSTSAHSNSNPDHGDETEENSFGSFGGIMKPDLPDVSATPKQPNYPHGTAQLERKILQTVPDDFDPNSDSFDTLAGSGSIGRRNGMSDRANRTLSGGSLSLQPPPRKRWTATSAFQPQLEEDSTSGFASAEWDSRGLMIPERRSAVHERGVTEPISMWATTPDENIPGFSFGTPEQKPRAPSLTSVSTVASGDAPPSSDRTGERRSSTSTKRSSIMGKRWSRTLPQRLTPPSGALPDIPMGGHPGPSTQNNRISVMVHPYTNGEPSTNASVSSLQSASISSRSQSKPNFSKRASGSSAFSVSSASTGQSGNVGTVNGIHPRPLSTQRLSIPPPARPPPTGALPAPPMKSAPADIADSHIDFSTSAHALPQRQTTLSQPTVPTTKQTKSFRDSYSSASRSFRLSLMSVAPKPPPASVLPPRPDEQAMSVRRRSGSSSRSKRNSTLTRQGRPLSLKPPPAGPLPAPPSEAAPDSAPVTRTSSLKRRLRMLSAPSPSPLQTASTLTSSSYTKATISPVTALTSQPNTSVAIGEKIVDFQTQNGHEKDRGNRESFLQLYSPTNPVAPHNLPAYLQHIEEHPMPSHLRTQSLGQVQIRPETEYPEFPPLSPAPRRASKQLFLPERSVSQDASLPMSEDRESAWKGRGTPDIVRSSSRTGSVISLGIVAV